MLVPEGMQVVLNPWPEMETYYFEAVEKVRAARVRFSQEFAFAKARGATTDGQATQAAIEKTGDELTTLLAVVRVIEMKMEAHR
jgi:hypothetical protein